MMLARKWDRLEEQCLREGYDIMQAIRSAATAGNQGNDGTTLAEVRDLRRYLLLLEAEMVEQGVVSLITAAPKVPRQPLTTDGAMRPDEADMMYIKHGA